MIYRGINRLEATNGANFTLECIYAAVIYYLTEKRKTNPSHRLRNIAIQMDNAKGNKGWTVFSGVSALVAYGLAVKAKLFYGLANHGHFDCDSNIGSVIMGVCNRDLPTLESFTAACIEAIHERGSRVLLV